jgi:hypothetical protein
VLNPFEGEEVVGITNYIDLVRGAAEAADV